MHYYSSCSHYIVCSDSKNITLKDMCRKGLIREGDVIVYKRNFSACKVVVSKSMNVRFYQYKCISALNSFYSINSR
jgi:hypothetical protein